MRRGKRKPQRPPKYTEAEKAQRRREYRAYLNSAMWQAVRNAAIYRAGGKCIRCHGSERLQVHHVKYPREFGQETPEMLEVLCNICHGEAHGRPYVLLRPSKQAKRERKERLDALRTKPKRKTVRRAPLPDTPSLKDRF